MRRFVLLALVFVAPGAFAQDWETLTDAPDLSAWQTLGGEWSIAEGVITGKAKPGENGFLLLPRMLWDFEVELEFRTPTPTNGGLQFRSHWLPQLPAKDGGPNVMYGYQANVETRQRSATGRLVDENGRGPIAEPAQEASLTLKQRDWNTMRVVARGPEIEIYLHDQLAVKLEDDAFIGGYLGLQAFAFEMEQPETIVEYRNLKVKDLGRNGTWTALFDGSSFAGWKPWGEEEWNIEDGVIVGTSGPKQSEGYLATEKTWSDFRVRGEFQMMGDGNYGLFFHSTIKLREKDNYPVIAGVQGEVEPSYPGSTGWVYESYQRGWLVEPDKNVMPAFALRPGAWNEIEIQSQNHHIKTWVNGIRVLDFDDPDPRLSEGSFALQLHTGGAAGIRWRELHVRD